MDDDYIENQKARRREMLLVEQFISTGGYCQLCGYHLDPRNIQLHHIAGEKHNPVTIPICHNCHQTLSRAQSSWPKEWLLPNQPPKIEMALMLRGHSDIEKLMSQHHRQISEQIIEKRRREGI